MKIREKTAPGKAKPESFYPMHLDTLRKYVKYVSKVKSSI